MSLRILATTTTIIILLIVGAHAYVSNSNRSAVSSRRDFTTRITSAFVIGTFLIEEQALALENCPPGSNNCVKTTWYPPAGSSKRDAIVSLRQVLEAYPQQGQEDGKVDGGGWSIAVDELDTKGTARIEYKSSGKGAFAKFFNAGKPFIDDFRIEVGADGVVEVRSQSRVGDSDFGVNSKRVNYIATGLSAKGWKI